MDVIKCGIQKVLHQSKLLLWWRTPRIFFNRKSCKASFIRRPMLVDIELRNSKNLLKKILEILIKSRSSMYWCHWDIFHLLKEIFTFCQSVWRKYEQNCESQNSFWTQGWNYILDMLEITGFDTFGWSVGICDHSRASKLVIFKKLPTSTWEGMVKKPIL